VKTICTCTAKILHAFQGFQLNSVYEEQYKTMIITAKPHVRFLLEAMALSTELQNEM
jgi:hypothetical protein